jgi:hypothetical protein
MIIQLIIPHGQVGSIFGIKKARATMKADNNTP